LGELSPTKVTIQLADRSVKFPKEKLPSPYLSWRVYLPNRFYCSSDPNPLLGLKLPLSIFEQGCRHVRKKNLRKERMGKRAKIKKKIGIPIVPYKENPLE